ncbi:MAG: hypothetical protein LH649_09895 [Pseudanabaena sp. CAN_BIN31]|nr:hypothetical protein [Pseudanabaena sp. CAN_BIN31]
MVDKAAILLLVFERWLRWRSLFWVIMVRSLLCGTLEMRVDAIAFLGIYGAIAVVRYIWEMRVGAIVFLSCL